MLLAAAWGGVSVVCTFLFAACISLGQSRDRRRCRAFELAALAPDVLPAETRRALTAAALARTAGPAVITPAARELVPELVGAR